MKLVCTIGTQGLSDGRRFYRGDVYEVDDETASTAVKYGYATVYVEPEEEPVVPTEPEAPADKDVVLTDDESEKVGEVVARDVPEETDVQPPMKEKTTKRSKKNKR